MDTPKKTRFPLVFLIFGCTADDVVLDETRQDSPVELTTEESLDPVISIEDEEDITIIYSEASASLEVVVNTEKLTRSTRGSTIEMQVDVTTPDGATTRHDFNWTEGEDQAISRIEAPVLRNGAYEVVVAGLAIDGRPFDGPLARQRMDVRGGIEPQEAPKKGDDDGGWDDDDGGHDDGWDDDDGGHDGWDDDDGGHDDGWDDDDGGWDDDDGGWDDGGHGGGGKKCKNGKTKHGDDHNDKIHGSDRNDKLYGHDGKDRLYGYDCHDFLYGGRGRDYLEGGKGRDYLDGGKGDDTCKGGGGKDEFRGCEYIH